MKEKERKKFWNILNSFNGEDLENEKERLLDNIYCPKFLCRYRSINTNNLEALRTNKIFFSKASNYDDPFDTFLNIDIRKIASELEYIFSSQGQLEMLASTMKKITQELPNMFSKEYIETITNPKKIEKLRENDFINQFLEYLATLRTKIQEEMWSACFSENFINESLWLKYADNHRGYALIYDISKTENYLCGKSVECKNCLMKDPKWSLFPIVYSDTPYDATNFAKYVLGKEIEKQFKIDMPQFIKDEIKTNPWDVVRCSLLKKECHKYDEEWRMLITGNFEQEPIVIRMVPDKLVLGLRTSETEKKLLISLAKQAGIKHIYQSFIDIDNQLNAQEIMV